MPKEVVSVKNGTLVRVRFETGDIVEKSLACVGEAMKAGAIIVDPDGKKIPPRKMRVRRIPNGIAFEIEAIDPGPQYREVFIPGQEQHLARVYKA